MINYSWSKLGSVAISVFILKHRQKTNCLNVCAQLMWTLALCARRLTSTESVKTPEAGGNPVITLEKVYIFEHFSAPSYYTRRLIDPRRWQTRQ